MDDSTFHVIYLLVLGIAFIVPISIKVFKRWKTSESEQKNNMMQKKEILSHQSKKITKIFKSSSAKSLTRCTKQVLHFYKSLIPSHSSYIHSRFLTYKQIQSASLYNQ